MKQTWRLFYSQAVLSLLLIAGAAAGAAAGPVELISRADPIPDSNGSGFISSMSADGDLDAVLQRLHLRLVARAVGEAAAMDVDGLAQ